MRPRSFLLALVLTLACAEGLPAPAVTAAPSSLAERVRAALGSTAHRTVKYSAVVWDAGTGERLVAQNADTPRRTASVMKLATTGAALLALGPEHEMTLEIRAARAPQDGVLRGNLVVEGTGDPGLSTHLTQGGAAAAVAELARAVRAAGVERVEGDLVLDTSAFPGPDRHPGWDRQPWQYDWYMAPVTALTVNDACVDVTALPGAAAGAPARLVVEPPGASVPFVNALGTTPSRSKHIIRFHAPDEQGRIRVSGDVLAGSTGFTESVACVDAPTLLGQLLVHALGESGVTLSGEPRVLRGPPAAPWPRPADRPGVVLARHASRLADVVAVTNRRSQNLYAELILRHLGLEVAGDATFEGGCRAVREVLELGDDFEQEDGSGLSRGNRATVTAIQGILQRLYDSPHRIVFMTSLAEAGDPESTLRKRFRGERFEGRVLAKTGTLRDTKSLAGFVRGDSGRVYGFVILCEGVNWRAAKLQDAVVEALVDG